MPYMRPAVSKELLRGELDEHEVALHDERLLEELDIELISGRAVSLDPGGHTVTLSGGRALSYRRCLLATAPSRSGCRCPASRTQPSGPCARSTICASCAPVCRRGCPW